MNNLNETNNYTNFKLSFMEHYYYPGTMLSTISFNIHINPNIIPILQIKNCEPKKWHDFFKVITEYNSEIIKQNE